MVFMTNYIVCSIDLLELINNCNNNFRQAVEKMVNY